MNNEGSTAHALRLHKDLYLKVTYVRTITYVICEHFIIQGMLSEIC